MEKGKIIKYLIGAGIIIGGASYIYYNYFRGSFAYFFNKKIEKHSINNYINMYLEKIKLKINLLYDKNNWINDQSILCHINYLVKEIIEEIKSSGEKNNFSNDKEIKSFVYTNIIGKFFNKDLSEIEPFITDELIFLPQNKKFLPLQRHDEEIIKNIIKKNDEQQIEDSFFFASVKQIELDKKIEKIFEDESESEGAFTSQNFNAKENINNFNELITFKESFQEEFLKRYKYNSRYLPDVYYYFHRQNNTEDNISNSKNEDVLMLINKIVY